MIFQLIVLLVLFCCCEIRKWVIYCFFGRWAGGKKMLRSIEIHDFIVQLNVIFTWCSFSHYAAMLSSIKFAGLSYLVISQIKHLLLSTWSLTDFAHLLVVWASFVNNEILSGWNYGNLRLSSLSWRKWCKEINNCIIWIVTCM